MVEAPPISLATPPEPPAATPSKLVIKVLGKRRTLKRAGSRWLRKSIYDPATATGETLRMLTPQLRHTPQDALELASGVIPDMLTDGDIPADGPMAEAATNSVLVGGYLGVARVSPHLPNRSSEFESRLLLNESQQGQKLLAVRMSARLRGRVFSDEFGVDQDGDTDLPSELTAALSALSERLSFDLGTSDEFLYMGEDRHIIRRIAEQNLPTGQTVTQAITEHLDAAPMLRTEDACHHLPHFALHLLATTEPHEPLHSDASALLELLVNRSQELHVYQKQSSNTACATGGALLSLCDSIGAMHVERGDVPASDLRWKALQRVASRPDSAAFQRLEELLTQFKATMDAGSYVTSASRRAFLQHYPDLNHLESVPTPI